MFERLPNDPLELANRSMSSALGLANSLRQAGTGTQRWLGDQLPELTMPVLAMAGALDTKFVFEANAIAHAVVDGHVEQVPDAGHAAHLEQPQAAAELIDAFLAH
jgi:2-succinyl-6-hydroxy-2,4-cyclohexadiene-1-carboxylate synthase